MRYGVAWFGCLCAVLWVLLGFGVLEGHGSSVSGVFVRDWEPLICSHVQEYSVGLCVGVCAWVSMTRRKYLFSVTLVTFLKNISSTKT